MIKRHRGVVSLRFRDFLVIDSDINSILRLSMLITVNS